ncbi:putative plasmid stability protein y4jJ [Tistrella bauzanensis]|uniref:Plasmid stability protein y4jJ n=1 Tax=Tistrella bauzanensis TaxID=657419 RepID=A0ABQ1ICW0_9PROT|nr:plasmid stability protein [Tistrella bauzanensis]GGB33032.1 putative plasmid stability protein y4jJ [Tistrella bauzanensis]
MASITVRNLSDETEHALRVRAAMNGRSAEAELRAILEDAVRPEHQITEGRIRLGSLLAAIGREAGGVTLDIDRDRTPAEPIDLG